MRSAALSTSRLAAVLLLLSTLIAGHGHDDHGATMDMTQGNVTRPLDDGTWALPSYSGLGEHTSAMVAHISLMVLAWFFILPVGIMFSIARSKLALPTQFFFLVLNGLGVVFGTIYNVKTADLYENNAHHKIGWVATWVMTAQVIMSLIFVYSGRRDIDPVTHDERAAFLPVSAQAMAQHNLQPHSDYRWSGDSGHGTECSSLKNSRDTSPISPGRRYDSGPYSKPESEPEEDEDEESNSETIRDGFLRNHFLDKYLSNRLPGMFSRRLLKAFEFSYDAIDRTILILGFIAFTTGGVTYSGIFRSMAIFNGLAHFIKGGIFFWYGLLTLGRWMGCFADLGWAWNVKPTNAEVGQWKASLPSAEFVESFVIFLYGTTNVFLEHLAAWGGAWTAQDLEHVSISVMFFGGGLCGMLIESTTIRHWLNTLIDTMPQSQNVHDSEAKSRRSPPKTYAHSMNVLPGLIILLLGLMMSSHHQDSIVSTMVHAQWGSLLVGFSLARGVSYIITYISPPTSVFASRPPSELVSSFCLISGGMLFMASTKDIVRILEENDLNAMFLFTLTMGFTAFLMAWEIIVIALKGWTIRREQRTMLAPKY